MTSASWPLFSRLASVESSSSPVLPEGPRAEAPWPSTDLPQRGSSLHLYPEGPMCPVSCAVRRALCVLRGGQEGTEAPPSDEDVPLEPARANPAWESMPCTQWRGLGAGGAGGTASVCLLARSLPVPASAPCGHPQGAGFSLGRPEVVPSSANLPRPSPPRGAVLPTLASCRRWGAADRAAGNSLARGLAGEAGGTF